MQRLLGVVVVSLNLLCIVGAQGEVGPRFEVASLKAGIPWKGQPPLPLPSVAGGPGSATPTRFTVRNETLHQLIIYAYAPPRSQIAGPAWLESDNWLDADKFDIDAKIPLGSTKAQFPTMLQNLLIDRFGLKVHYERREVQVYNLVLGKSGTKPKENVEPALAEDAQGSPGPAGTDGFPVMPRGYSGMFAKPSRYATNLKYIRYPIEKFADWLSAAVKRPVVDRTGLTGNYDFYLEFRLGPGGTPTDPEDGAVYTAENVPDLFGAVQSELGLKLAADKGPVNFFVVDHAERVPSVN